MFSGFQCGTGSRLSGFVGFEEVGSDSDREEFSAGHIEASPGQRPPPRWLFRLDSGLLSITFTILGRLGGCFLRFQIPQSLADTSLPVPSATGQMRIHSWDWRTDPFLFILSLVDSVSLIDQEGRMTGGWG